MSIKKIAFGLSLVSSLAACSGEPINPMSSTSQQHSSEVVSSSSSITISSSALPSSLPALSSPQAKSSAMSTSSSSTVLALSSATVNTSSAQASSSVAYSGITPTVACPERAIFGARQVKLMTATEYQNTLEDLVGIDFDIKNKVPTDDVIEDFHNNFAIVPSESHIDSFITLADDISAWAKARSFVGLVDCDTTQVSCNERFVQEFGQRAYRRPLTKQEVLTVLAATSDTRLIENDNQEAIRLMMMSILSSPNFLFRFELGQLENDPGPTIVKSYNNLVTTDTKVVNATLNTVNKNFYEKAQWPDTSALIEITGSAIQGRDGSWPIVKIRNAQTTFETEFELSGSGTQNHQVFISEGITKGSRHFYVYLHNESSGAELIIDSITISAAQEVTSLIPYEPKPDDVFVLSDYELASFLSYTFIGSMPDADLLLAVTQGELQTEQHVENQVERLLATSRGKKQLELFSDQWLGLDIIADASTTAKDPALHPDFNQEIRDALAQEVREMFKHNVLTNAPFSEFFNSNYVLANHTLVNFYGLNGNPGSGFAEVDAGSARGGLLTTGAFMGAFAHPDHTAPIIRAVRIRERLMCQYLPDPPNNLDLERAESAAQLSADWQGNRITSRHYFGELTSIPACSGCHAKAINPLGFALEDYGPIGQLRTQDDNGHTIDARGEIYGEQTLFGSDSTALTGAKSVSAFLAASTRTDYCLTEKAFRYMNATGPDVITRRSDVAIAVLDTQERADYSCAVKSISTHLSGSQNVKDVFKQLSASNIVRYRKEKNR